MSLLILLMDCLWRNIHQEKSSQDPSAKLMARGFFVARMMPVHCWSLGLLLCDRCQAMGRQLIHLPKRSARMILLFSLPSMMTDGIRYSSRCIHANLHPLKQCIFRPKWMMRMTDSWIFSNLAKKNFLRRWRKCWPRGLILCTFNYHKELVKNIFIQNLIKHIPVIPTNINFIWSKVIILLLDTIKTLENKKVKSRFSPLNLWMTSTFSKIRTFGSAEDIITFSESVGENCKHNMNKSFQGRSFKIFVPKFLITKRQENIPTCKHVMGLPMDFFLPLT